MLNRKNSSTSPVAPRFQDPAKCEYFLNLLSIISNEYRFKVLCLLTDGDFCVHDIAERVGGTRSNISQQLKILSLADLISKRREGKMIYYHLKDERIRKLLHFFHSLWEDGA
jgi:ArsR family transcriptional regulator, lead/cadmium/zinc/bismuth-responsive transcriptional repressor